MDDDVRKEIEQEYAQRKPVEKIPASKGADESKRKVIRVAAYCRVSTDSDEQLTSYITQKTAYEDLINGRKDWELVGIYADEGISGTSLKHRDDFNRLIADAKAGLIDMVITKSISRFARNVVDCVTTVRMLKDLVPPVAVFFEDMNINTLSMNGELLLVILAAVAQGESEMKSVSVKWGFRKRFEKGIPKIGPLYGYNKDGRKLTINEEEATVVRAIYYMFLDGYSINKICDVLNNQMHIPSPKGKAWGYPSVKSILQNEKHCGDVITQKTICIDMFEHKTIRNTGQLDQYKIPDHHEGIVSKEVWETVQEKLKTKKKRTPLRWEDHIVSGSEEQQSLEGFSVIKVLKRSKGGSNERS